MSTIERKNKMVIYQVFPRWFGNSRASLVKDGSLAENGVGKFSAFTPLALSRIKELGVTHVWYTGVIEHATRTDYTAYGWCYADANWQLYAKMQAELYCRHQAAVDTFE